MSSETLHGESDHPIDQLRLGNIDPNDSTSNQANRPHTYGAGLIVSSGMWIGNIVKDRTEEAESAAGKK